MTEPTDGPKGGGAPTNTRVLTIAAVLVAALALVVAIGLTLRSNQDSVDRYARTTYPTATIPTTVAPAAASPLPAATSGPNRPVPPPTPARRIGDDCSTVGTVAQWRLHNAEWVCVPQGQGGDHQMGEDCSHDGIVAQWGQAPDGSRICIPQQQGGSEPQGNEPPPGIPGAELVPPNPGEPPSLPAPPGFP
ncbi:hypothetical protein [Nocardia sp. NPDC052566]|uniref:hypothetical protein n=1 Tax=Nocardia sp. NPDC052566 TaxID=3364330 RepID=UPI0037CB2436